MTDGIFRSDAEVALNDLVEALASAAAIHARGADTLGEGATARALRGLADCRQVDTRALLDAGLAGDEAPNEPDPDRVTAEGLVQQLRTALAPSQADEVVAESRDAENRVASALEGARNQAHAQPVEHELARLSEAAGEAHERLAAAETAAKGGA